jgi:hypothetical protein
VSDHLLKRLNPLVQALDFADNFFQERCGHGHSASGRRFLMKRVKPGQEGWPGYFVEGVRHVSRPSDRSCGRFSSPSEKGYDAAISCQQRLNQLDDFALGDGGNQGILAARYF